MKKLMALAVTAFVAAAACGSDSDGVNADITVTFDGEQCEIEGPAEFDPGQHTFLFIDESDRSAEMWVRQLVDDVTYDEHIEYLEEQGGPGVYVTKPEWVATVPQYAPEKQLADGQHLYSHDLPADGLFSYTIGAEDVAGTTDEAIWFCGPLRT